MAASKLKAFAPNELALYHKNPRRGDIDVIKSSLRAHGQYRPVVVNIGTHTGRPNEVLAGNHTLIAFRDLAEADPNDAHWRKIDAYMIDVDDDEAKRIVAVDNRSGELGTYDNASLLELLDGINDLDGTGYTDDDLSDLRALLEESAVITDPALDEGLVKNQDLESKADGYADQNSRVIVLQYPITHFMWMQDKLTAYRKEFGLESNSEALITLVSEWAGEAPPLVEAEPATDHE